MMYLVLLEDLGWELEEQPLGCRGFFERRSDDEKKKQNVLVCSFVLSFFLSFWQLELLRGKKKFLFFSYKKKGFRVLLLFYPSLSLFIH
jgi:hypothetical protein